MMDNSSTVPDLLLLQIERSVKKMLDSAISAHYLTREQVILGLKLMGILYSYRREHLTSKPVEAEIISEEKV